MTRAAFLELDLTARRNLELTETLQRREKRGSLLWVLDRTKTPMGTGGCCARVAGAAAALRARPSPGAPARWRRW
jgi:hypothetical protein